jgi:hypothetical protein
MGYYKEQNIELLQKIQHQHQAPQLQQHQEQQELEAAEKAATSYLQPFLAPEFSDYPEADSLLDFVKAFQRRKANLVRGSKVGRAESLSAAKVR